MSRQDERVPPLKPLAYYAGVDVYERLRSVRRRSPAPTPGVRILGYHRVTDALDPLGVTPRQFRLHMEEVRRSGARVMRLADALSLLDGPVTDRIVCVTFDDGYRDTVEVAAPILRGLEIPATVYVPTAMPGGDMAFDWYRGAAPPALTWDDAIDLAREGLVDVQSHTRTHPRLPALDEAHARAELVESKAELERRTGMVVTSVSYPAGLVGPREARLAAAAGYRAGVTCHSGLNRGAGDVMMLRRTMIRPRTGLARFQLQLAGGLDHSGHLTRIALRVRGGT